MAKWEYSFKGFKDRIDLAGSEEALDDLWDLLDELGQADVVKASEYLALSELIDRRFNRLLVEELFDGQRKERF